MKVLVIGGGGFIGQKVADRLTIQGYSVKSSSRESGAADIRDFQEVDVETSGFDVVVNCAAALPHSRISDKDFWDINVLGVKNVVDACLKNKVKRLVHISTTGVFGPTTKGGVSENSRIHLSDIYTETKHEGDKIIMRNMCNISSVIIRPTIAYGPGDTRPVFLRLFRMIKTGIILTCDGGENFMHTVYVNNLVEAISLAVSKKEAIGEDFIIGDDICPKFNDITETIAETMGVKHINISLPKAVILLTGKVFGLEKTARFVSEDRRYKIDKAVKLLGYNPKIGLIEGMKETYSWYRKMKMI